VQKEEEEEEGKRRKRKKAPDLCYKKKHIPG
jgi:hypothetical protein